MVQRTLAIERQTAVSRNGLRVTAGKTDFNKSKPTFNNNQQSTETVIAI